MINKTSPPHTRGQHVLSYMIAGIVGLSLLAFIAVIFGTLTGVRNFAENIWPIVFVLPMIGLPIGFVLIIVLMVITGIHRRNTTREPRN